MNSICVHCIGSCQRCRCYCYYYYNFSSYSVVYSKEHLLFRLFFFVPFWFHARTTNFAWSVYYIIYIYMYVCWMCFVCIFFACTQHCNCLTEFYLLFIFIVYVFTCAAFRSSFYVLFHSCVCQMHKHHTHIYTEWEGENHRNNSKWREIGMRARIGVRGGRGGGEKGGENGQKTK